MEWYDTRVMKKEIYDKIPYLNAEYLRRAVLAGARRVIADKDLLNRINVFPVADADTGSNLAATMKAVIRGLAPPHTSLAAVSTTVATCALSGARGNSGVIMAQFFQGLREGIAGAVQVSVTHFVKAAKHAALRAREALANPQEGTILTVMADFADHIMQQAERIGDFCSLMEGGLKAARRSLDETTNRLAVLRKAGVVDAGALGFVRFLEGFVDSFTRGEDEEITKIEGQGSEQNVAPDYVPEGIHFRYCTEAILTGEAIDQGALKERLVQYGDSIVVAGTNQEMHVHIHTNAPAEVLEILTEAGEIRFQKVEDMLIQLDSTLAEVERSGIALVTDSVCDLPQAFLTEKRIWVIPLRMAFGEEEFLDRVEITPNQFYKRLARSKDLPKTSQPAPAEFLLLYRYLARHYAGILSIHLSAEVSGTYQLALNAARTVNEETGVPIEVVDTRTASAGEGLSVWAAARAIEAELPLSTCRAVAEETAARTSVFVYVPSVEYFVRGGRLSPVQGRLAEWLHLTPILTVKEGKVAPAGRTIGRCRAMQKTLFFVREHAQASERPMFVIAHSAAPALAEYYAGALARLFPSSTVMRTDAAPALGSHAGPGGGAIAVLNTAPIERMIEEAKNGRAD